MRDPEPGEIVDPGAGGAPNPPIVEIVPGPGRIRRSEVLARAIADSQRPLEEREVQIHFDPEIAREQVSPAAIGLFTTPKEQRRAERIRLRASVKRRKARSRRRQEKAGRRAARKGRR